MVRQPSRIRDVRNLTCLRFQPESTASAADSASGAEYPSLLTGIREQLGLDLGKGNVEMIVIDSMDREPAAN
jgi:uncharacterized protein (TIGR03435 family)